jgi:hypothetical protein
MKREVVQNSARFAGQITRYHTWPVFRQQSNGEHTFQVMRIYYQIWGELPQRIAETLLWHDLGEMHTGDMPFPVKRNNPTLKQEADRIEKEARRLMGEKISLLPSGQEALRMKVCDLLEMWEFGKTEVRMGNQYAVCIEKDTWEAACELVAQLPREDQAAIAAYTIRVEL